MFDFAETTKNMTATEILNYYRNLYYAEPQVTERGIVANAINDVLPNMVEVVRCKDCKYYDADSLTCELLFNPCATNVAWYPEDFCSYGERRTDDQRTG